MLGSNRFKLIAIGVGFAAFVLLLVAFTDLTIDDVQVITPSVEALLGVGVWGDTKRRMGRRDKQ